MLEITPVEATLLGLATLPICLWVAYTDLSEMKIRNNAVLAMIAAFAVLAPFVMPLAEYGWRWAQFAGVLGIGFALHAIRAVGAGDAKFAAAMAPFVAPGDATMVLLLFSGLLVATWLAHRTARAVPAVRGLAPHWQSWHEAKDFPMGITLAATHVGYLAAAALSLV